MPDELIIRVEEANFIGLCDKQSQLTPAFRHLNPLRQLRPGQPHYLERGKPGKLVGDWNLVVPPFLYGKTWEET